MSEVRGNGEEGLPHTPGQGQQLRGSTQHPRSGGCMGTEGREELLHVQGQRGSHEEIPLLQGKEQQLCFAGAAVKRYSTLKARKPK